MDEDKKQMFLEAFRRGMGIVHTALEAAGATRAQYRRWLREDEAFSESVSEVKEMQADFVESSLLQKIKDGDTTATIFYLKTRGKKRGWTEKEPPQQQPKQEAAAETVLQLEATATLPMSDTERAKDFNRRVENRKSYFVRLLKKERKYTPELSAQVTIAARLSVSVSDLEAVRQQDGYHQILTEISREGNTRQSINPTERLYLDYTARLQSALRALGMNTESRERKGDGGAGLLEDLSRFAG